MIFNNAPNKPLYPRITFRIVVVGALLSFWVYSAAQYICLARIGKAYLVKTYNCGISGVGDTMARRPDIESNTPNKLVCMNDRRRLSLSTQYFPPIIPNIIWGNVFPAERSESHSIIVVYVFFFSEIVDIDVRKFDRPISNH